MRTASVLLIITLLVGLGSFGCHEKNVPVVRMSAEPASDLQGWKTAKWGMTPDEVKKALGGEAKNQALPAFTDDAWNLNIAGLKLPNDNDLELKIDVHFVFDENAKLRGVTMALAPEDHGEILLDIPFDYFEKQLSAKYGPPTHRKLKDFVSDFKLSDLVWNLRFTTITVSQCTFKHSAQWGANSFFVAYSPREKNDAL